MINLRYVLVGVARRAVPQSWLFAIMKMRGTGNLAETSPGQYYTEWWRDHLGQRRQLLKGKRVLEVGSGRYARLALHWLAAGAKDVTLADLYATRLDDAAHRALLAQDCVALGLDIDDALSRIQVIRDDFTKLPYPDSAQQFDLVLTSATLEHVRDPQTALTACWHWLKPGGATYHMIDLRDHNFSFRYPFEMLTFSDGFWNRWLDLRAGFHLNRWRVPDYMLAMRRAGFSQIKYETVLSDQDGLRAVYPRLHTKFCAIEPAILAVLMMCLYGEKPHAE